MTETEDPILSLRRQLACYRKLQKLCELQRQYVQQNQTDELLQVLEARGQLVGDISQLESSVASFKRNWAEACANLSEEARIEVESMLAEARELLQQITQADQDDVLLLQQRKLNVGKQIAATSSARQINNRYAASAYGASQGSRLNVQK